MKDNRIIKALILVITLIGINLITFLTVNTYTTARVINIIFLNIAIIAFETVILFNVKSKENKFLNYSKIPLVSGYSIITFLVSFILILINPVNLAITIVPHVIITGIFLVLILTNQIADNSTEKSVAEMRYKIMDTKNFTNKLYTIMQGVQNRELYRKIEKVYDASRSLKINIQADSSYIDSEILRDIDELDKYVEENNIIEIDNCINRINKNFIKRNNF